jgi:L-aspartate oxidase
MEEGRITGVTLMDQKTGEKSVVLARSVLLATGGAGQIFSHTTNPSAATGDGLAMAFRAGAEIMDLEFFQFHPTAFHLAGAPRFLLTEALRGEGAVLKNSEGKAFMKKYHPLADLAPRDIVSRAIVSEMFSTGSSWVYLDATSIGKKKLNHRFPNIQQFLQTYELDLGEDLIPVSPSAHYWMGGVRTGLNGETSLAGLYAAGEVACNGVHGANRLASNSLLEGLVYGARAGTTMLEQSFAVPKSYEQDPMTVGYLRSSADQLRTQVQSTNWKHLGLLRNEAGITQALQFIEDIPRFDATSTEELELLNLVDCSKLMGSFALQRRESRGSHFREDYPSRNPEWNGHHSIYRDGKIELLQL